MSRLGNQAAVLSIARLANYGLMLVSPMILVRILSVTDFGHYREFLVYTSLLIAFAGFNVNDSLLYFIPAHTRSKWRIVRQTVILVACSSTAIVALVVALDWMLKGALIGAYLIPTAIYVLLSVNVDFWEFYWLSEHRSLPVFFYTTGRLLARMAVVIAAAVTTHRVITIVWLLIALEGVRLTASTIAWRLRTKGSQQPVPGLWRDQLKFCMPWGVAVIFAMLSRNLGNIAVVKWLGAAPLAYYTIGLYGEPIIVAFRNSVSFVLLPEMVRRGAAASDQRLAMWGRGIVVNCILLFPMIVLLIRYAEPLIVTVFGAAYRPSVVVLQLYALVILRECFDMTLPLRSANRTSPLVQSSLVGLLVNAVTLFFLMPIVGIAGGAIGLAAGGFAEVIYLGWCIAAASKVALPRLLPWRSIGKVGLAALSAGCVVWSDVWTRALGFPGVVVASAVYIATFGSLLWLFRLPEAELIWDWAMRAARLGAARPAA